MHNNQIQAPKAQTEALKPKVKGALPRLPRRMAGFVGFLMVLGFSPVALAIPPTFSIIGPQEFALPIPEPGEGIGFFFQNTVFSDDDEAFDANGDDIDSGLDLGILSISRFGKVFQTTWAPNVGWYWEYLQPAIHQSLQSNVSVSGLGDPLVALAAFIKPVPNATLGFENFFSIPIGDNDLSADSFGFFPGIFFDYAIGNFGIDGTIGGGFFTDAKTGGNRVDQGDQFYVDLRFRYAAGDYFVPFVGYDYDRTGTSRFDEVGAPDPAGGLVDGAVVADRGEEHIAQVGTSVYLDSSKLNWINLHYAYGIEGENRTRTNAIFTKLVFLFP